MQSQARNERPEGNNNEKWKARNPGRLSDMRHKDVQDRQEQIGLPVLHFYFALGCVRGKKTSLFGAVKPLTFYRVG